MKIILKYKKTFITVIIISFMISILPAIAMTSFMAVGTNTVTITEEEVFGEEIEKLPYEPFSLAIQSEPKLELPVFENFNMDKKSVQKSFSEPTNEQEIVYQAYLEEGMTITLDYNMRTSSGHLNLIILDEDGARYTVSGTKDNPSFTIHESGNYGVAYHASGFKGSFSAEVIIKNNES